MADDNTIVEGSVKFRDGRKWKSRWCVMRKLSPVADCVHVQLYRDARARWAGVAGGAGGGCKASLSLQQFLGCEAGFTLDKQSNTLALVCRDHVLVLAFDTRERLLQWQVKVSNAVGCGRVHSVVVARGSAGGRGPARLLVGGGAAALTAGCPPRLLAVWDLPHLRRFGVVEGRFCLEGGARCGRGAGLHVLVAERAHDIAADFAREAATAARAQPGHPAPHQAYRPDTRLAELQPAPDNHDAADQDRGAGAGGARLGDSVSVHCALSAAGGGGGGVTLERCMSCMSKLGAMSRSSTAALSPGAQHADFSPAWTMDPVPAPSAAADPPPRPPRAPPPPTGPYDNYDVPKIPSTVEGEYYDTPKRLRECLDDELLKIPRSSDADGLVLRKPCGCLLRMGRSLRRPAVVDVDAEDDLRPSQCPCRRVTEWANSWIKLPYCGRGEPSAGGAEGRDKENLTPNGDGSGALYATVDVSRKPRRRHPPANYENLNFALSLEHYENARDVLRRAGVTRAEFRALSDNYTPGSCAAVFRLGACGACGVGGARDPADDYLTMVPGAPDAEPAGGPPPGYTPMSPVGGFAFHTLKRPARSLAGHPLVEKSASNPALCTPPPAPARRPRAARKRSSSADSSRFLEDVEESGALDSASSAETLRAPAACGCGSGEGAESSRDPPPRAPAANRDSSSSNDSGVSSWSLRAADGARFELPLTTAATRRHYRRAAQPPPPPAGPARRSRSAGGAGDGGEAACPPAAPHKSSSAEAEVPLLCIKALQGAGGRGGGGGCVTDAHSTSSGTSDMSDYIETLSLCSSHSSTDTPLTMRVCTGGACVSTSTLRPRSGGEYHSLAPRPRPPPPAARHAPDPH